MTEYVVVIFFIMGSICYNLYRFNKIEDDLQELKFLVATLVVPELRNDVNIKVTKINKEFKK